MITIKNVSFSYTEEQAKENRSGTVRNIQLQIEAGECVLLCGESGCGKTTVTKLINGLIPHFAHEGVLQGDVFVCGKKVEETQMYELAKQTGSVFQNPKSQFFSLDTDSELAFGLENAGADPEYMKKRLKDTIKNLHLEKLVNRNIFSLSGGEKQMLAFASVYAMNPSVYVLDEPTANLDYEAVRRLREQICTLKKEGHTVVIAEHRLSFLADLIDRAYYLRHGRIEQIFTGEAFRSLSEQERTKMGLRSIKETKLSLPTVRKAKGIRGLKVENLTCGYRKALPVFENLSFLVEPGQVLAVTGKNGAGKSTLGRTVCGLLKEQSGQIFFNGEKMNVKKRRRNSFCVMQDVNHQLFYDSVFGECEQAAGGRTERIEEILESFDLLTLKEQHPMALSGGQKQRLAVATALLSGKEILIFDEPTSGLDYRHMQEVCQVVRRLADEGKVLLLISHDREFMNRCCDCVLHMEC